MNKKHIFYLDVLRTYAICMVVLLHAINPYIIDTSVFASKSWYVFLVINGFVRTGVPLFL